MVKIRYAELPAGLHVTSQAERRGTVVYLLPGLTADQRRAALVRARSSARMGHGPSLPASAMAVAIVADRASTTTHNGAAAVRRHPMLVLPLVFALAATAIVFVLTSSVALTGPPHGKAVAGSAATLGMGASQLPRHGPSLTEPPKRHHHVIVRRSRHHTPSPSTPAAGYAYTAPSPSGSLSPRPTPSATRHRRRPSPSPSPSASETCLKVGPLGLCVTT
jgi:hypothetical protein